eukprot:CAMPEP_0115285608 /NCGR_PEP_ID=MMETSP0270-20121206/61518_1 /TAXON_ID=71861 /ORGANISM="Scrippsiella trochoidea, Strain CCMP3099" /LENGTH=175 /DNA_ID=CAMNT_0002702635 /DNA_START=42 /DNA_END=569 /DNA_ORIENTATION=+
MPVGNHVLNDIDTEWDGVRRTLQDVELSVGVHNASGAELEYGYRLESKIILYQQKRSKCGTDGIKKMQEKGVNLQDQGGDFAAWIRTFKTELQKFMRGANGEGSFEDYGDYDSVYAKVVDQDAVDKIKEGMSDAQRAELDADIQEAVHSLKEAFDIVLEIARGLIARGLKDRAAD